jgi:hypothetical protein
LTKPEDELKKMLTMMEQLAERVNSQEEELKQLRQQIKTERQITDQENGSKEQATSRRRMLKKLGVAAAGLAIAGAAVTNDTQTILAASDLSGTNPITSTGVIRPATAIALPILEIDASPTSNTILASNTTPLTTSSALLVTATGTNYGIISVAGPTDVLSSDFTTANPPLKPAAIQGRGGVNSTATDGNIGVHGISDAQVGVVGQFQDIAQVTANLLINDAVPANGLIQSGVIGASDKGVGVLAASNQFSALYATASGPAAYSIYASRGTHSASGVLTTQNLAPLYLEPSLESYAATSGPATNTGHRVGEIHVDKDGKVWVCAAASGAATFPPAPAGVRVPVELRNAPAGAQAGVGSSLFYQLTSTVYLDNPIRILGPYNTVNPTFPVLAGGATAPNYYKIEGTWSNQPPSPAIAVTATIPTGAIAVIGTVAIISPTIRGYATLYPANASSIPVIATTNYQPNIVTNASFSCKLGTIPSGTYVGTKGIGVITLTACQIALDIIAYIM